MAILISFIAWVIFNLAFVIPAAVLLFYTVNSIFPVLAAVEDLDAPIYESLGLGRVANEDADESPVQQDKDGSKPRAVSSSFKSMFRLLYSGRKCFSLSKGFGWLLLWNMVKCSVVLLATFKLPSGLGFLAQVLLPLALVQLHTLWVHTILASPSPKPFWRRLVPASKIFKAVALPMLILLMAEATTQRILLHFYRSKKMKWEDFFPMGTAMDKAFEFWLLLAALTFILIIPAHLLLVRVEASVLPADERTIIPLDPAISVSKQGREYITFIEAGKSLTRTSLINLIFLYVRIFLITGAVVALVGFVDFTWYIIMALQSWRF
ncbi:hypothetical protein GQ53DRAFT_745303 [Thozetella sp. PMI_491]|nr:hypothetical protein GQ53DRAFT_745303 [Thozetella sp. PMI_491]